MLQVLHKMLAHLQFRQLPQHCVTLYGFIQNACTIYIYIMIVSKSIIFLDNVQSSIHCMCLTSGSLCFASPGSIEV